jgi:RNA polymerase sigma-70 factor, ECF subfamily
LVDYGFFKLSGYLISNWTTPMGDGEINLLLEQVRNGDRVALDRLTNLVARALRPLAHSKLRLERPGHLLQTTALVNEAFVRLKNGNVIEKSPNSRYLFAAAGRAMRAILVDHARVRKAASRAGMNNRVCCDELLAKMEQDGSPILELNEALEELGICHPRQASVIDLRYFGGCSIKEASELLGVSEWTIENDFRIARAWLRAKLEKAI